MTQASEHNNTRMRLMAPIWVALALAAVWAASQGWWPLATMSTLAFFLSMAPILLASRYNIALPLPFLVATVAFIIASLIFGEVFDIYYRIWWWDMALHGSSAVALGMIGFLFIYMLFAGDRFAAPPGAIAFLSFTFALSIGAVWEIFEYGMDQLFGMSMQKSVDDTMIDLITDAIGAVMSALAGYAYLKGRSAGVLGRLIRDFIKLNRHLYAKGRSRNDK